jgi:hypothetical protein
MNSLFKPYPYFAGHFTFKNVPLRLEQAHYSINENLVLFLGCRPYGPEAGPGQRSLALSVIVSRSDGVLEANTP